MINEFFLLESKDKESILCDLQIGFFAEWAEEMPSPNLSSTNYFKDKSGIEKCRARFNSEIKAGRMIGGWGWTQDMVRWFLGGNFYTIPCGAVPKNQEPLGRIIHDYSSPSATEGSVNSALINTSVQYISFVDKADNFLKSISLSRSIWKMDTDNWESTRVSSSPRYTL